MLAKMGGRLISFYADDLAELMLEDFLAETVIDLQRIEKLTRKEYATAETQVLAENLLDFISQYEADENLIDMRWNNKNVQREIKGLKLGDLDRQPRPIEINFNEATDNINQSFNNTGAYSSQKYENPFARIDPFAKGIEEKVKVKI